MTRPGPPVLLLLAALLPACGPGPSAPGGGNVVRVGHFPNVTHVHGLVAHALSREGRGWFEERLGPGTRIEWFVYSAGPSAMMMAPFTWRMRLSGFRIFPHSYA